MIMQFSLAYWKRGNRDPGPLRETRDSNPYVGTGTQGLNTIKWDAVPGTWDPPGETREPKIF